MIAEIDELLRKAVKRGFKPIAYYQESLDCLRIEFQDCSMSEHRENDILTILYDMHPVGDETVVGLTISSIRPIFKIIRGPLAGTYQVAALLDEMVKKKIFDVKPIEEIIKTISSLDLTVNFGGSNV